MVAPLLKAVGALVVGTPVAVVLGLTARSIRKQEDAEVPVVRTVDSPLTVGLFSNYLDKRTHELLDPKSFKKGYVVYDARVQNRTAQTVRGAHVELVGADGLVIGAVRLGDVPPRGHSVFAVKKAWNRALEEARVSGAPAPTTAVTWKAPFGRRRAVSSVNVRRVLGESSGEVRRRRRAKAPVISRVMS